MEQWHGDFQVAHVYNGVIIAGCHCDVYDYSSTDSYPTPTNYWQVAPASWLMAFSPNGLTNLTDFAPQIGMSSAGEGIWGITLDSYGCVWAAGDIVRGAGNNWLGGFARFCSRDTAAPTTPTNAKVVGTTLSWSPSTDNSGAAPQYEVIRNDPCDCDHHSAAADGARSRPVLRSCDRRRREPLGVHNRDQRLSRERSPWERRHLPCNDHAGPTRSGVIRLHRRSRCVTL